MARSKAPNVKITRDTVSRVVEAIRTLSRNQVMVGIPSATAQRAPDPDDPKPINNAAIGYIMENGSPINNIPERPWLVPGARTAKDDIVRILRKGAMKALEGDTGAPERAMIAVGLKVTSAVKNYIIKGTFEPLSERTLKARRARGVTRTAPLRDTLQMLNSVTYVIRPIQLGKPKESK